MPLKRHWRGSSKYSQAKRSTSSAKANQIDAVSSSPGFETPIAYSKGTSTTTLGAHSTGPGPASRTPVATSSPGPRVSLRPLPSHITTSSPSISHVDDDDGAAENDEEVDMCEYDDAMNEVIMAVDFKDRSIGCAYYVAREEKLCMMEDVKLAGLEVVDTLKLHIQPTVLLISTRSDEALEDHLNKEARSADREHDPSKNLLHEND
jgi:hypothetical protein